MKNLSLIAFALLFAVSAAADIPADYVWDSMSRDSSQSMPVGGGDIGLNVWAEDGDVLFTYPVAVLTMRMVLSLSKGE